ncbi:MAG: protease inhibitor I42 family protein [Candidatus Erginobacter occultus]|nr:protease inhibitor I42 family protein [Candidatus Erginobacter occultus]
MNFVKQVILYAAVLAATIGAGRSGPTPTIMHQTPVYTEPKVTIKIEAGAEFTIALDSNPTTGYSWNFAEKLDPEILTLVDSRFQPPETRLKGAGGKQFWTFRALKEGRSEIALKYFRSWEKDVPPAREADFTVIVEEISER